MYQVLIPGHPLTEARLDTRGSPGMISEGQTDIVSRLINGYDPRLVLANLPTRLREVLEASEYVIYFARMVLQDAIDFAVCLTIPWPP